MSKRRYHSPEAGEWVQYTLMPDGINKDACCGCGLVHNYELKILPTTDGKHLTIWRRSFIDNRATAAMRRAKVRSKRDAFYKVDGTYVVLFPVRTPRSKKE